MARLSHGFGKCWQVLGGSAECAGLLDFVRSCQNLTDFDIPISSRLAPLRGRRIQEATAYSADPFSQIRLGSARLRGRGGVFLGVLVSFLGGLGALLGRSEALLRACLSPSGGVLGPFWGLLGALGSLLGAFDWSFAAAVGLWLLVSGGLWLVGDGLYGCACLWVASAWFLAYAY
mgnify:CR=1 FL=1